MPFKIQPIMTIDTETASLTGGVYDIAFSVHTRNGRELDSFAAVVRETATNPRVMKGAFYADKMFSHYVPALAEQRLPLMPWADIVARIRSAIETHDVQTVAAYNLGFDRRALRATHQSLGHTDTILPREINMLDIWEFVCRSRLVLKKYKTLARAQGWVSEKGNILTNAECAYRFISGNLDFKESHTAAEDTTIEREILANCFRAKGPVPYNIITGQPWRLVNAA